MVFWPPTRGALTNTSLLAVAQTLQSLGVPLPNSADAHLLGNATDESGAIALAWALALDRASLGAPRRRAWPVNAAYSRARPPTRPFFVEELTLARQAGHAYLAAAARCEREAAPSCVRAARLRGANRLTAVGLFALWETNIAGGDRRATLLREYPDAEDDLSTAANVLGGIVESDGGVGWADAAIELAQLLMAADNTRRDEAVELARRVVGSGRRDHAWAQMVLAQFGHTDPAQAVGALVRAMRASAHLRDDPALGELGRTLLTSLQPGSVEAARAHAAFAELGVLRSRWQRPTILFGTVGSSKPLWRRGDHPLVGAAVDALEASFDELRAEVLALDRRAGEWELDDEDLTARGEWRELNLYRHGKRQERGCRLLPKACALAARLPRATGCSHGDVKLSRMAPATHVKPHCGPTNARLRLHLPLVAPTTPRPAAMRVASEEVEWEEGEVLVFDDSYEHEVWQRADADRIVLIVDIWHPTLDHETIEGMVPLEELVREVLGQYYGE